MAAEATDNTPIYSIQRTYIINLVPTSNAFALTCNQRIDVPVIDPDTEVQAVVYDVPRTVVPCVEIKTIDAILEGINLVFETSEGANVLPVKIGSGIQEPLKNPYSHERFVLALPRGTTGIKSCKVFYGENGDIIQHNFTFGIMPPPYNYDNALFGYISYRSIKNSDKITELNREIIILKNRTDNLKLVTKPPIYTTINLPKGAGKQTIKIANYMLYFWANFTYSSGSSAGHSPKITVSDGITTTTYTLTLDDSVIVTINLLAATITANVSITGEIVQQLKLFNTIFGYKTISFENFDDISDNALNVFTKGAGVE